MESLEGTTWDVVIAGTGLQQSLLSLALSRSGKKILHVDKNNYYGGSEAAFSLSEAQEWAESETKNHSSVFRHIRITSSTALSHSRNYNLALAPQLIYSRSKLIRALVSSKSYKHLEFLAVGSWWIYKATDAGGDQSLFPTLSRVPSSQEDVFAIQDLDLRGRRKLMKFLRFLSDYENQTTIWQGYETTSFKTFLNDKFGLDSNLQQPLLALTLSLQNTEELSTTSALQALGRYITSMGVFGRGFSMVVPRWGGLSEIAQVGCRAGAVGGAVYILGVGIAEADGSQHMHEASAQSNLKLRLTNDVTITTDWLVGEDGDLSFTDLLVPNSSDNDSAELSAQSVLICVVSSPLTAIFPILADGSTVPAAANIYFPTGSVQYRIEDRAQFAHQPVHLQIHSSSTGECPLNECVLYAVVAAPATPGLAVLDAAVDSFLAAYAKGETPLILWRMHYEQSVTPEQTRSNEGDFRSARQEHVLRFPPCSRTSAFDDGVLNRVEYVWNTISGDSDEPFMHFNDRDADDTEAIRMDTD